MYRTKFECFQVKMNCTERWVQVCDILCFGCKMYTENEQYEIHVFFGLYE